MEIDKGLLQEIKNYCKLNGIKDVNSQINSCLRYGFNVLKFGDNPFKYHNPMDDIAENNSSEKEEVKVIVDEKKDKTKQSKKHGRDVGEIYEDEQRTPNNDIKQVTSDIPFDANTCSIKKPKRKIRIIKN